MSLLTPLERPPSFVLGGAGKDYKMKKSKKEMEARLATDLVLQPDVALLSKLGSIAVHVDEMLSPDGHHFDRAALQQLLDDPAVKEWLKAMDALALIPKKRNG